MIVNDRSTRPADLSRMWIGLHRHLFSGACSQLTSGHNAKVEWFRATISIVLTIGILVIRQPDLSGNQNLFFNVTFELDCNADLQKLTIDKIGLAHQNIGTAFIVEKP